MLRIYCQQQWFNLWDPAVKESLYDSAAMRSIAGIDLGREPAPDERTILRFRHLLECHQRGVRLFDEVGRYLKSQDLKVATGTLVDATIFNALPSTKNKSGIRDPQLHQTKKRNQWYFGMKAHIEVDSRRKLIHSVVVSAVNLHDKHVLTSQLHGRERRKNLNKSKVRSRVKHAFLVSKRIFGFDKVRYRGIAKNRHRPQVTCALVCLFMARRHLLHREWGSYDQWK